MTESIPQNSPPQGKASPILIVFLVFGLFGIAAAIGVSLGANKGTNGPIPTPLPVTQVITTLIDKPAPNFQLDGLDGKSYRLSSYRGRVVFVNFWATWCVPCQTELPALAQFQAQQGKDGAVILAVNQAEKIDPISTYLKDHNITGLNILLDVDVDVNTLYDVPALPTTFVIDKGGTVRYKHLGEMKPDDLASYMQKLNS